MIAIRAATAGDADAIAAIYAPVVRDTVASFEETPPNGGEIDCRMQAPPLLPWLAAVDGERVAGYAYASKHRAAYRWSVDCSVYVDGAYRRRGVGGCCTGGCRYAACLPDTSVGGKASG